MASVELRGIDKSYPGLKALDDVSLSIASGCFFTLLGPSGCGKTTLLRTIAGFHRQDAGSIFVEEHSLDDVPAHKRNIGMVFQDYAIFPHMSVGRNVAFGLRNRSCSKSEITDRVARALDTVRLGDQIDRMPHQLSGGQQQRVGLARAMVINPAILLMDEPLSNLDAKLRIELREDIRALQRRLGITTIYVTHDQEEALVVSDLICVMEDGRVHQVGTPWEIYRRPESRFVASFVGAMNFIDCERQGDQVVIAGQSLTIAGLAGDETALAAAIRPEDVVIGDDGAEAAGDAVVLEGDLRSLSFAGREALCVIDTTHGLTLAAQVHRPTASLLQRAGQTVSLRLPAARLLFYGRASHALLGGAADAP